MGHRLQREHREPVVHGADFRRTACRAAASAPGRATRPAGGCSCRCGTDGRTARRRAPPAPCRTGRGAGRARRRRLPSPDARPSRRSARSRSRSSGPHRRAPGSWICCPTGFSWPNKRPRERLVDDRDRRRAGVLFLGGRELAPAHAPAGPASRSSRRRRCTKTADTPGGARPCRARAACRPSARSCPRSSRRTRRPTRSWPTSRRGCRAAAPSPGGRPGGPALRRSRPGSCRPMPAPARRAGSRGRRAPAFIAPRVNSPAVVSRPSDSAICVATSRLRADSQRIPPHARPRAPRPPAPSARGPRWCARASTPARGRRRSC